MPVIHKLDHWSCSHPISVYISLLLTQLTTKFYYVHYGNTIGHNVQIISV